MIPDQTTGIGSLNGPPRIGLALSGGGFRAALYHLGTIRCLEEAGVMDRVEVMSTVSGGSIIGAYYLVEMERRLRARCGKSRLVLCDEIINEFCRLLGINFRMRALIFYPFYHPIQTLFALFRLRHAGDTMAKAFERHLFAPSLRIGDLPVQSCARGNLTGTRLLINTTSLITGRRIVFSRESDTGLKAQVEKVDPNNIVLARAVGASASVPGLFKPLRIANDILADGGLVDNQGIESLLDYFEITEPEFNLLPKAFRQPAGQGSENKTGFYDGVYFLVSDGGGQFSVKDSARATRSGSAARSMDVLQAANRRKVLKLLLNAGREGNGGEGSLRFAFTHLAMNLKGKDFSPEQERLPSELIGPTAELRTDLDEFSRLERDVLIYHGYTLMKRQIGNYCPELEKKNEPSREAVCSHFSWPPPFVELCAPAAGHRKRAKSARCRFEGFLRVGHGKIFRDLQRFPQQFGPAFFLSLLLGHTFSKLLLALRFGGSGQALQDVITEYLRSRLENAIPSLASLPAFLGDIVNYFIHLDDLKKCFAPDGSLAGAFEFLGTIVCIAFSFYIALWLYWEVKQRTGWPAYSEEQMMEKIRVIAGDGEEEQEKKQ